ncbi:MAG: hypothetical protein IJ480_03625 [Clostridia bacterium]|nr:hypothetical protein [Clostridia bacterium]
MYSRGTDRGGRRIKLPPGYDGSAFRHDTGELRRYDTDTGMKIHSPEPGDDRETVRHRETHTEKLPEQEWLKNADEVIILSDTEEEESSAQESSENILPAAETAYETKKETEKDTTVMHPTHTESMADGLLAALGSEEWLLLLVILLLVADGSDAWDTILILGLLLAVKPADTGK